MRILAVGGWLVAAIVSGLWVVVFYLILRDGGVTLIEPDIRILAAEFGMAVLLAASSLYYVIISLFRGDL